MEEAVVGAVVGATIQLVLQNLQSISAEIALLRDFKKDLKRLEGSFLMIQEILEDAETMQIANKAVERWLKRLEAVAFDADNVLDELNYRALRNNVKKKVVACFFPNLTPVTCRCKIAHKIRDIHTKLELINEEAGSFGLQSGFANAQAPFVGLGGPQRLETDSFSLDRIFLGRDDDVSRIVDMLTLYPVKQVFSILPIVGMGGLGKTTLVRQVFGNEKMKIHFEKLIWVYVSQKFDGMLLLRNIVESLTMENVEFGSREVLLKKLQRELGAKRYLLVLDDLWNEDSEMWDSFINSLAGISSVKGNGIIVTTRSSTVASMVKALDVHRLEGLSDDDCWSIIKAKAFGEGSIPSEFENMGKNVAESCQGLPLAAKVVGGLLRDKSEDQWRLVQEKWLSDFGWDGSIVSKILKLSFDHLSSPALKKCFAYCSVFPKGTRIHKEKLIELWMAEGFLETNQSSDMETVGNNFLNILLHNSLLQVVENDCYGNITYCKMHDLVHDLASSVLCSKVNDDDTLDEIHKVRYSARDESAPFRKEQAKYFRTLFFEGIISCSMFSHFKSLHVLTLMDEDIKELPSSISKLIHLRCLDISYTRITCLPDSIGKLYHLQTLRAVRKYEWEKNYLVRLPSTLKYLISLRHLRIPNIELPPKVGMLTSLRTLPYFQVGDDKGHGIVELGNLKNLKGQLEIHNLEKVRDKEEAKRANLSQKSNIFKLKFVWGENREDETNDEHILDGLQPHPNLKSLEIYRFEGRSFPLWTLKWQCKMAAGQDL